jgi:hypothetical protein
MDAFSYLSVLLSVILGLAIQQVLLGYRALALARGNIRWYAPPLIWSALVILLVVQHWWAMFALATRTEWSFAQFGAALVQTALFYMMAAIVLPDVRQEGATDLREHYYREAPLFFGVSAAVLGWNLLVREYLLFGELPGTLNLSFQLFFLALSFTAMAVKRPRFHEIMSGVTIVLLTAYIALLFGRL